MFSLLRRRAVRSRVEMAGGCAESSERFRTDMNVRYQVSIASVGGELQTERAQMVKSVVALGHFPVDLTAAGVLERDSFDAVERHLGRSDYFILIIERGDAQPSTELERVERAVDYAAEHGLPVLGIGAGDTVKTQASTSDAPTAELPLLEALVEKVRSGSKSMFVPFTQVAESAVWVLVKLIDTYKRGGWVSSKELPSGDVASELVRLAAENADLRKQLNVDDPQRSLQIMSQAQETTLALNENKILIPIWERAGSTWEKPVELTLYDFFVRLAPELVVETSVIDAAEFIPTGVCELEPVEHVRWVVPHRSVNLWFTDLMALGLVTPSDRKHAGKDQGHYWTLTQVGREFLSDVRRSVLNTGGHRHIGFTSEFPIFTSETKSQPSP